MRRASKAEEQKLRSGQQVHAAAGAEQEPNRSRTGAALIEGEQCLQASFKRLLRLLSSIFLQTLRLPPQTLQVGALTVSVIFSKPSKAEKQKLRCGQQVRASALLQCCWRSRTGAALIETPLSLRETAAL
ncbi:hypothetical protein SRHO_G00103940 [Serrasalmus rhombeus]